MIIICPACDTKFMLPALAMGAEGRTVRCAKCGHSWHAMPNQEHYEKPTPPERQAPAHFETEGDPFAGVETEEAEEAETATALSDADLEKAAAMAASLDDYVNNKPVPEPKSSQNIWKMLAALLLLGIALLLGLVLRESLIGPLGIVYKAVGYYPESGVALANISLKQVASRPNEPVRYDILCEVVNQSDEARVIPPLAMKILNSDGVVLAEDANFLQNSGDTLAAGKSVPCKGLRFANPFSTAATLVMDMGSPLELSLRGDWTMPSEEEATAEAPAPEVKTEAEAEKVVPDAAEPASKAEGEGEIEIKTEAETETPTANTPFDALPEEAIHE